MLLFKSKSLFLSNFINVEITFGFMPLLSKFLIEDINSFVRMGLSKNKTELCFSFSYNKLYLLPTGSEIWVTNFSLIASRGGFETCANICLK